MADGCSEPRFYRAIYCPDNLVTRTTGRHPPSWKREHKLAILAQIGGVETWCIDRHSGFEHFLQREKLPGSPRFFVMDLEGVLSTKPPRMEQAAMVDITSFTGGCPETVFNVNVDNVNPSPAYQILGTFRENLLEYGKRDYWHYNKHCLSGVRLTPRLAAEIIKYCGVTPKYFLIVWHRNRLDVSVLRDFLSKAGYYNVLPGKDHIIRLPYLFKHNLDLPDGIPYSLELLFGSFFRENSLRFTHHDALIDSKKAALMTVLAEKLCKGEDTTDFLRTRIA